MEPQDGQQEVVAYKGWRAIPIQHQELDPDFQVVPQSSVSAYLGEQTARAPLSTRPEPRTLDGDMLLDACNENFPGDVYGAKLTGQNIEGIATEDAPFFLSLARLDLSDNRIPFEQLAAFPALRDVSLQCNGLRHLSNPGGFAVLEVLDLSVNAVAADDIRALAELPCLKELDISRNGLSTLPPMDSGFAQLTKLAASGNRLRGDAVLDNLAELAQLQCLLLNSNRFDSMGPLIRAAVDAAEAADTGGYRGQWAALQRIDICDNQLSSAGGFEVMLALPSLAEVGVRGNPAFMGRHNAELVRTLRQTFETGGVNMNVGPMVQVPEQKMGTAYTAMAPSMVTVSDTLQQSEYATDPELWDILDSSDEEDTLAGDGGAAAAATGLPPRYELNEDGEYKTAADMRAAYNQLRHVLEHPDDFMRAPKPSNSPSSVPASSKPRQGGASVSSGVGSSPQQDEVDLEAERLSSMEEMLRRMKERTASLEANATAIGS